MTVGQNYLTGDPLDTFEAAELTPIQQYNNWVAQTRAEVEAGGVDGLARNFAFCAGLTAPDGIACPFDATGEEGLAVQWANGVRTAGRQAADRFGRTIAPGHHGKGRGR